MQTLRIDPAHIYGTSMCFVLFRCVCSCLSPCVHRASCVCVCALCLCINISKNLAIDKFLFVEMHWNTGRVSLTRMILIKMHYSHLGLKGRSAQITINHIIWLTASGVERHTYFLFFVCPGCQMSSNKYILKDTTCCPIHFYLTSGVWGMNCFTTGEMSGCRQTLTRTLILERHIAGEL